MKHSQFKELFSKYDEQTGESKKVYQAYDYVDGCGQKDVDCCSDCCCAYLCCGL